LIRENFHFDRKALLWLKQRLQDRILQGSQVLQVCAPAWRHALVRAASRLISTPGPRVAQI